jgi:hypothetical protein
MGLAVQVENAASRIVTHAAGAVLVADAFKGYALLEVSMEWDGGARVAGLLENIDPTVFKALEGLDVVRRVGELNPLRRGICHGLGLVGSTGVSRGVGAHEAWLPGLNSQWRSVVECHSIFRVGQILGCEPPRNSVVLYSLQGKVRSEGRSSPFIISKWKLPTGCTWPNGNG